jgi:hypothetical protein
MNGMKEILSPDELESEIERYVEFKQSMPYPDLTESMEVAIREYRLLYAAYQDAIDSLRSEIE